MLMHSEILALTLQHARPRRCRSPACFSIPSHFLFLLNYPRLKSLAPLESFHGRRLKSGSLRAFAPSLLFFHPRSTSPVNPQTRVPSSRNHRKIFLPKRNNFLNILFLLRSSREKSLKYQSRGSSSVFGVARGRR
ncbi:hypothetical protein PUN28_007383 [Cardiocondyla obscurior]|uniref:Uncharacterized protein n=1 Tax=Cardiocondyla obscurior TaxID=286306 RepID=A0AAW2G4W9_9HYME